MYTCSYDQCLDPVNNVCKDMEADSYYYVENSQLICATFGEGDCLLKVYQDNGIMCAKECPDNLPVRVADACRSEANSGEFN